MDIPIALDILIRLRGYLFLHTERLSACLRKIICNKCEHSNMPPLILLCSHLLQIFP